MTDRSGWVYRNVRSHMEWQVVYRSGGHDEWVLEARPRFEWAADRRIFRSAEQLDNSSKWKRIS